MNEREQVISNLLYMKRDCLEGSDTDKTLDRAIALLKAQEPIEPRYIDGKRNHFIMCGNCNTDLIRGMKYCSYCGRAVKWK